MNLAIIGATGNVGRKTVEILEKSKLKFEKLFLVASDRSVGKKIDFKGKKMNVIPLSQHKFSQADITFFAVSVEPIIVIKFGMVLFDNVVAT